MKLKRDKVVIDNLKINYFEGGTGQDLLFLHGAPVSAISYRKMLELLAVNFHVIAPDAPGFGRSSVPKELWDFSNYARIFSKFISLKQLEDVYLAGNSFGGGIASVLGGINDRVTKIALFAPAAIPTKKWPRFLFDFLFVKTTKDFIAYKNFPLITSALGEIGRTILSHPLKVPHMYRVIKKCVVTEYPQQKDINVPTQITWFRDDEIFPLKDADELNMRIRNSKLKIMNGYHDWCYFHPEKHAELITKFSTE